MIKAIIYDMDDLMVNSDPLHVMAWEKLLKDYNHKFFDIPENLRSNFIGMRVIDVCREVIDILKIEVNFEKFYQKRIQIFLDLVKNNLEAMPGLIDSLELFKFNNYKIALASSGAKKYIDVVLDKFNIRKYFDIIISGDDVCKGKPDPEIYLLAAKKLECLSEECLVLEDAKNGIESAISAGCKCIAIINHNTPPQDHSRANLILHSLKEITIQLIKSLE